MLHNISEQKGRIHRMRINLITQIQIGLTWQNLLKVKLAPCFARIQGVALTANNSCYLNIGIRSQFDLTLYHLLHVQGVRTIDQFGLH